MNVSAYCLVSCSPVRLESSDKSEIVTQLLFGELVEIIEIQLPWAKIRTFHDNYEGYVDNKHLKRISEKEAKKWLNGIEIIGDKLIQIEGPLGLIDLYQGSYIHNEETFNIGKDVYNFIQLPSIQFKTIQDAARSYLNAPYLWGGKSPFGIDCSGFTQMVFRYFDFNLPRDASQQVELGMEIDFDDKTVGDLAFFNNSLGRVIHVGIILENSEIIHASGHIRIDLLTVEGIYNRNNEELTHNLCAIRRLL